MNRKAIARLASLPILLILLFGVSGAYSTLAYQPAADPSDHSEVLYKNTPTPKPTVEPTQLPIEYRTQSHNPGLIIGAVVLLLIILFGVLRYARPEAP